MTCSYYEITAFVPEEGEVCWHVQDEKIARMVHSDLYCRQLDKDGTHSVTVSRVPAEEVA
jgi:hypothetical protein